eukprot:TRINITY_DN6500_c0_g3_i3.p2 TRINITY_DN6500_c0_g3~~TRINITY_DN6500_c0_g3_i3.p2  ORF type:complete len:102 (+),score=2.86 TRINITY_DN6500_c0_g3_i3:711-1016(+)
MFLPYISEHKCCLVYSRSLHKQYSSSQQFGMIHMINHKSDMFDYLQMFQKDMRQHNYLDIKEMVIDSWSSSMDFPYMLNMMMNMRCSLHSEHREKCLRDTE